MEIVIGYLAAMIGLRFGKEFCRELGHRGSCAERRGFIFSGASYVGLARTLGCLLLIMLAEPAVAQNADAPSVIVAAVERQDVSRTFSYVGRIEAADSVALTARVSGYLGPRSFREGGDVKKGDLLFVIEQEPYQIAVEQYQADLAGAQATLKNAQTDFTRKEALVKRKTISQATLDEARAALGLARANVQQARAALRRAKLDLSYTQVKSPIDGRISRATYSTGALVGPNSQALATVTSVDPVHVTIAVTEKDLIQARREGIDLDNAQVSATLKLSDGSDYGHVGAFDYLDPSVNQATDTILVRAIFPNPDRILLPGQFVTLFVRSNNPQSALVIPQVAVQEDREGYFVLVVDRANQVAARRVVLTDQIDTGWVVEDGLAEGERVVVQGLQKVRPNMVVNVVAGRD